jgi:hypothetical protein
MEILHMKLLLYMTLGAHDGPFLLLQMAVFAVEMVRLDQFGFAALVLIAVTLGTGLILRGFILYNIAVLIIQMVALGAVVQSSGFIVFIMGEDRRPTLGVVKHLIAHKYHIFLGVARRYHQK